MAQTPSLTFEPVRSVRPRCPNCGSDNVREWGRVDCGQDVANITIYKAEDGSTMADSDIDPRTETRIEFDAYEFDELRCRECDHSSSNIADFLP